MKPARYMNAAELGLYLGYPLCCVKEMVEVGVKGWAYRYPSGEFKLSGTGFIPCVHCNEHRTEEELLAIINANRQCPTPFPNWQE